MNTYLLSRTITNIVQQEKLIYLSKRFQFLPLVYSYKVKLPSTGIFDAQDAQQ